MKQLIKVRKIDGRIVDTYVDDVWNALYDNGIVISWACKSIRCKGKKYVKYYKFDKNSYIFDHLVEKKGE